MSDGRPSGEGAKGNPARLPTRSDDPPSARPDDDTAIVADVLAEKISRRVIHSSSIFSGPFPPPAILDGYGEVDASFPPRIFRMGEIEQEHRHGMDRNALRAESRNSLLGIVSGFVVALSGLATTAWIAYLGHPAAAAVLGTVDLVSLVGVFIYGTRAKAAPPQLAPGNRDPEDAH